jgi:hypothetical protein
MYNTQTMESGAKVDQVTKIFKVTHTQTMQQKDPHIEYTITIHMTYRYTSLTSNNKQRAFEL